MHFMDQELNILSILLQSGWVVKAVLLLLILGSIASWAVILMKRKNVKKIKRSNLEFLKIYRSCENLDDVYKKCHKLSFSHCQIMFLFGHQELQVMKEKSGRNLKEVREHLEDFGLGILQRGLSRGAQEAELRLEEGLSFLASVGSLSPFVGLFGTVWGIIDSFTGLASGGSTLEAVAPGIAEALVATAVGLAVAIPAVWFYNFYTQANRKFSSEMEMFEKEFLNSVEQTLIRV